jgi:hypothetical protein
MIQIYKPNLQSNFTNQIYDPNLQNKSIIQIIHIKGNTERFIITDKSKSHSFLDKYNIDELVYLSLYNILM